MSDPLAALRPWVASGQLRVIARRRILPKSPGITAGTTSGNDAPRRGHGEMRWCGVSLLATLGVLPPDAGSRSTQASTMQGER